MTEAKRRTEGRIAARRCWEAARVAVSEETRDALQRAAVRYALKAIGIETEGMLAADAGLGLNVGRPAGAHTLGRFTRPADWNV